MVNDTDNQQRISPIESLEDRIFDAKQTGLTDMEIGEKYNVNLRFIEKVMVKRLGVNVTSPDFAKPFKRLNPVNFSLEPTTVWSFKSRGNWATHNGNYRGNWSPFIPRNVIQRYSKEGETVLDCFCGAGTTGVECRLTNRNFIGIDINPNAIELAKENSTFPVDGSLFGEHRVPTLIYEVGDARDLSTIDDESIDLICTHPPYADIIHYTDNKEQDLSFCGMDDFLEQMAKVARENHRVLKTGRHCAVLIGDMRKKKHVIPLGYRLIDTYLRNGFRLKELVIKRQHNCKTTGFWYKNSIKYNFLLLAHEYLAIFEKSTPTEREKPWDNEGATYIYDPIGAIPLESTTVWIFSNEDWYSRTIQNLVDRYDGKDYRIYDEPSMIPRDTGENGKRSIIILNCITRKHFDDFCNDFKSLTDHLCTHGQHLAILCNDIRQEDGTVFPMGIELEKRLLSENRLNIKELVVLSIENGEPDEGQEGNLAISHRYILVYRIGQS